MNTTQRLESRIQLTSTRRLGNAETQAQQSQRETRKASGKEGRTRQTLRQTTDLTPALTPDFSRRGAGHAGTPEKQHKTQKTGGVALKTIAASAVLVALALATQNCGRTDGPGPTGATLGFLQPAHAHAQTGNAMDSHIDDESAARRHGNADFDQYEPYVITPNMSLVRRRSLAISPFIDGNTYADVSLIVLDTEGLAYNTDFTRNLLWVTRLTDNLLNVRKPGSNDPQQVCALGSAPASELTRRQRQAGRYGNAEEEPDDEEVDGGSSGGAYSRSGGDNASGDKGLARHLVPSYDGYVYCVYETGQTQLLHIHVRDIVNFTPFRTPLLEGVYLEGARSSSVMALDFDTGNYLTRQVHDSEGRLTVKEREFDEPGEHKTQRQLHIGYTDWTVRAFDEKTHEELWSFNWREIGAVNSEHADLETVERVREVVKVNGQKLSIQFDDDDEEEAEELNFPFPIAAVFAVLWNVNEEIMTLQLLDRIAIPPPATFLQNTLDKAYGALRLSSSSYVGHDVLSLKNGVINVHGSLDTKRRWQKDGAAEGTLIKIKVVEEQHYHAGDGRAHQLTLTEKKITARPFVKWWWVVICWVFTFACFPVIWLVRRAKRYCYKDEIDCRWMQTIPYIDVLIAKVATMVDEMERSAFHSTERLIHNVDRISSMQSVEAMCKSLGVPLSLLNKTREVLRELADGELSEEGRRIHSARNGGSRGQRSSISPRNVVDITDEEVPKEDSIQAITLIPSHSPLSVFLENGRLMRTFECIKLLGRGGFGSVYRAQHRLEPGNPIYAIKLVLLNLKATEGLTARRYFREVAANREIYSKYVVRYFTWWCEEPHFLPLAVLTPDIQSAAAMNVKYLISTKALTAKRSKQLQGVLEQYQEAVREIVENTNEDSFPSFSKIAEHQNCKMGPRKRKDTLKAIGENSESSRSAPFDDSSDSMLMPNNGALPSYQCNSDGSDVEYQYYPDSDSGVEFEDSQASKTVVNGNKAMDLREKPKNNNQNNKTGEHDKALEKHYPIVLLILMEHCKGFTLREWLNRPGRSDKPMEYTMTPDGVPVEFGLFRQLVKGLRDIHCNNYIHRDIKPENIFVDPKTNVLKIGDFGLVAFINRSNQESKETPTAAPTGHFSSDVTQASLPGQMIGTPGYTAPEGGVNCTEKADIYSAALILLELLSPRFTTVMERFTVLENFRNNNMVPEFVSTRLRPWHQLLLQMGDHRPDRRPSAAEVLKKLKEIINAWKNETDE